MGQLGQHVAKIIMQPQVNSKLRLYVLLNFKKYKAVPIFLSYFSLKKVLLGEDGKVFLLESGRLPRGEFINYFKRPKIAPNAKLTHKSADSQTNQTMSFLAKYLRINNIILKIIIQK